MPILVASGKTINNYIIPALLLLSSFTIACKTSSFNQVNQKDAEIKKLIKSYSDSKSSKAIDKIFILKNDYCKEFDCESYFQDYKEDIQIYSRAQTFMRGITNVLVIEKIDNETGEITIKNK